MSRPQKMHKPLKGGFDQILGSVAIGKGMAKRSALKARKIKATQSNNTEGKRDNGA